MYIFTPPNTDFTILVHTGPALQIVFFDMLIVVIYINRRKNEKRKQKRFPFLLPFIHFVLLLLFPAAVHPLRRPYDPVDPADIS